MNFPDIVEAHNSTYVPPPHEGGAEHLETWLRESALIELVMELELYMEHKPECNLDPQDFTSKCTCGLQALLDRLEGG